MKKIRLLTYPKHAKVTTSNCLRDDTIFKAHRFDAKYCSDVCKVQDNLSRKEKGYKHLVAKGKKDEIYNYLFLNYKDSFVAKIADPDIRIIEGLIQNNPIDKSWKEEFPNFRLNFLAPNKKKPYELYYTNQKRQGSLLLSPARVIIKKA
jgi:hypothetical protein